MITKARMNELKTHAEALMMGFTVEVSELPLEETEYIIDHVLKTLGSDARALDITIDAFKYCKAPRIKHLNVCNVIDMRMLTLTLTTKEDTEPYDILSRNGVFSYVYNIDAPFCSELGYTFFEQKPKDIIRRIG